MQAILVTRFDALQTIAAELYQQPILGVDTESNSLHAYRERVCLIQFSTLDQDYLIDPLALQDLSPLAPVFSNPQSEKIFHAAEYDVLCMKRDFGFVFANLFDTMMAARILGIREVGLGSLLQNEFGITLDKRYQRANWGQRPLPEELLEYARQDTHHLIPLRDRLYEQLNSKDLLDLAAEDFERVGALDGRATFAEPESSIQFNGAHDLTPQQLAVLQELCGYRDRAAYDMDRPLFKVIGNDTLIAIAKSCPAKFEDLRHIPGMTNGQLHRHGRSLLSAVQRGLQAKPIQPLRPPRPDGHYLARLDALRQWRKSTAIQWQVESDVVLPREVMVAIAEQNPMTHEQLSGAMACTPWRFEHFGSQILAALKD